MVQLYYVSFRMLEKGLHVTYVFVSPTVVVVLYSVVLWMVRVFAGSVTVIVVTPEYTVTVGGTAGLLWG